MDYATVWSSYFSWGLAGYNTNCINCYTTQGLLRSHDLSASSQFIIKYGFLLVDLIWVFEMLYGTMDAYMHPEVLFTCVILIIYPPGGSRIFVISPRGFSKSCDFCLLVFHFFIFLCHLFCYGSIMLHKTCVGPGYFIQIYSHVCLLAEELFE